MANTLRVMSTLAVELALKRSILPDWMEGGHNVQVFWNPTSILIDKVREGARSDVLIAIDEPTNSLAADGILRVDTVRPIAQAGFGVGVLAGGAIPDITTIDAFKSAVINARSIAYSLTGASGRHFLDVIEQLGIGDEVKRKAIGVPAGFTAQKIISGEADMAIQQISELMVVDGIHIAGPFPGELQKRTDFSAAVFAEAADVDAALAFIEFLTSPSSALAFSRYGLVSLQSPVVA
ncbi:substrate-binding domain-containing protein [Phyllobacterium sp. SB3]|uniref:molybdate ABC transporter substrate-binding protein n=1 Tax=Phyllobacterium sp. SB3 TaxID=3156073 RepID=UPI0032AF07BB